MLKYIKLKNFKYFPKLNNNKIIKFLQNNLNFTYLNENKIINMINSGEILQRNLEKDLYGYSCIHDIVKIRQLYFKSKIKSNINYQIPFDNFDTNLFYNKILNKNCENVIGYIPIPVGCVGPLKVNNTEYYIPLATTEGALVASTNRGCKAITESNGANSYVLDDGMTRSPLVTLPTLKELINLKEWIKDNFDILKKSFESTTKYGKLISIEPKIFGLNMYIRFKSTTGDAMGMNIISKGTSKCLDEIKEYYPNMSILSLGGNTCIDKKPSAMNWINGRGKYVIAEVILSKQVVNNILKSDIDSLVELNNKKNLIGSSVAGSIGGFNAHASNIITSTFIATGQDVAQNVESSNCMTLFEKIDDNNLHVSVTLPCLEVGTIGGGTGLPAQSACLNMLGIDRKNNNVDGENSILLAEVIASTVLAGEISLMSALSTNNLIDAHMKLNR